MTKPAQPATPTQVPWLLISLLAMAAFSSAASLRVLDPLLPRLSALFDAPVGTAAMTVTAFSIAYGALQLVFGPLGDRYGKLRVIAMATGLAALTSLLCALAGDLDTLIAARALVGVGCAAIIPLSMAWIGDNIPYEERQPVLARFLIGQILGLACGQAFGGLAAESPFWQWPLLVFAALFVLTSALLWFRAARNDTASVQRGGHLLHDLRDVLRLQWARTVLIVVGIEGVLVFGAFAFIATHLHYRGGLSLASAGLVLATFALGGLTFAIFARRLVPRLGERRLVRGGAALIALALAALSLWPQAISGAIACYLLGLGFYMIHNTLQTHATQMAPARRGAAVALFASCYFVGQSIGVGLAALVVDRLGTVPVLLGSAVLILPLGLTFAVLHERRQVRTATEDAARVS